MIVVGIDPHMKTHTAVAVDALTGQVTGEKTVRCDERGRDGLLLWARSFGPERLFAIEDCRHISGRLERFLLTRGEQVVRVPPKMMAGTRASARAYGKSDPIDAMSVARAALREPALPTATLVGPEHDVRLLSDHRDDLVAERQKVQKRLRWNCHDLEVSLELPPRVLDRYKWLDQVRRCRELTREIRGLEREILVLVRELSPELLRLPGCSAIGAAHLVGETAGATRFKGEAAFAMHNGTAPLPASSGKSERHRLNRTGNRRLNAAIHMIAVTQARMHAPAIAYVERKQSEGMSYREALRCLKRHISRAVFKVMLKAARAQAGAVLGPTSAAPPIAVAV